MQQFAKNSFTLRTHLRGGFNNYCTFMDTNCWGKSARDGHVVFNNCSNGYPGAGLACDHEASKYWVYTKQGRKYYDWCQRC